MEAVEGEFEPISPSAERLAFRAVMFLRHPAEPSWRTMHVSPRLGRYSYLKATMGSTSEARLAGR